MLRFFSFVILILSVPLGAVATTQAIVYSDNTTASSPVVDTLSPLADFITVDCQDPDGCDLTMSEAVDIAADGSIVKVIMAESAALMGTVWALHFVSSALKVGTIGLSTILTAGAQGAIAYYSTYLVGQAASEYLAGGKSWGDGGPKLVVKQILDSLDRDTVLRDAKREIQARLGLG